LTRGKKAPQKKKEEGGEREMDMEKKERGRVRCKEECVKGGTERIGKRTTPLGKEGTLPGNGSSNSNRREKGGLYRRESVHKRRC